MYNRYLQQNKELIATHSRTYTKVRELHKKEGKPRASFLTTEKQSSRGRDGCERAARPNEPPRRHRKLPN